MSNVEILKSDLLDKINDRSAIVAVIGLGYVGLPLAVEKAKAGFKTIGFDVQKSKVDMVNSGKNYIGDILDDELSELVKTGMLSATDDISFVRDADFITICVPTPLDKYQQPDISYVKSSAESVSKHIKRGCTVVLESTTYPGTTEELLLPILENGSNLKCGEDFFLAYSPERVDPGNKLYKTKNTPKVVGGVGKESTEVAAAMYRAILDGEVHEVSSPKVAELEKILENTYRNINIALANEMTMICEKIGISVWEVIEAASTKPYGFQAFYPGPGVGGHCIPLDPYYLAWKAREYDYHAKLIETSGIINDNMPYYVVERASKILNRFKKSINGSKILVLGVAYKQDIDDYRESPALKVIKIFEEEGANVDYFDPFVKEYIFENRLKKSIGNLSSDIIQQADIVVVTTAHTTVDYNFVQENAKYIFDTKNALKNVKNRDNIELL